MKTTLWNELLDTPSVRDLISRIVNGLADQVSQLLLIPAIAEQHAIYHSLLAEALRRDFSVGDISFAGNNGELTPASFTRQLCSFIDSDCTDVPRLEEVLREPILPEVIFLLGVEQLSGPSQRRLIELLSQWSRISQNAPDQGGSCSTACCIAEASSDISTSAHSEVHLNIEWWWGFPSMLETSMLCRYSILRHWREADAVWKESLAPSLCAGDVTYISEIWPFLLEPHSSIWRRTREYGEQRGWDRALIEGILQTLPSLDASVDGSNRQVSTQELAPPAALRFAWSLGILQLSAEAGCELHPAALAIAGQIEALEQRMWRAQAALLLPKLDAVRHDICRHMAKRYGPHWPTSWASPKSDDELEQLQRTHLACQWGYLEYLLRSCPRFREERRLRPLVAACRQVRNELAHYRPIEFGEFKSIWEQIAPFG